MNLTTTEKFLLLAQHPEKGRSVIPDSEMGYGFAGTVLMEMILQKRIVIEDKRVVLRNEKNDENPVISEITAIIRDSKKQRKLRYWISKLAGKYYSYRSEVMDGLERKVQIRIEHRKFLGLFPYRKYFLADSRSHDSLIRQLRECALFRKELTNENIIVLALIEACNMYRIIADNRDERKTMKRELKIILSESSISEEVNEIIKIIKEDIRRDDDNFNNTGMNQTQMSTNF